MTQIWRPMAGSMGSSLSDAEFLEMNITFRIFHDFEVDATNCVGLYTVGGDRVGQLISDDYREVLTWLKEKIELEIEKNREALESAT